MKIRFIDKGKPAPAEAIQSLEAAIGRPLSKSVRRFLNLHDGARPEPRTFFRAGRNNASGVSRFIPIKEILAERGLLDYLPASAYPITHDGCGNYAFIDEDMRGAVFFWDHEVPDEPVKVAKDLDEFLGSLEVHTLTPQDTAAAATGEAWIDPKFIHLLKKKE